MRDQPMVLGAFVLAATLVAASLAAAANGNTPRSESLRIQQMMAEFFAAQEAHDKWASQQMRRCKSYESMKEEHACYNEIQPELDRRQCAIYEKVEKARSQIRGAVPAKRSAVCERIAREK